MPIAAPLPAAPPVEVHRSRGIRYFEGRVRCPLAGAGQRGPHASNRLVLDDARTAVTIDRGAGRITVENGDHYEHKTVIADLLFLAEGRTASGRSTPFSLHLKILKKGRAISLDLHRHLRTQEPITSAEFEPFEVVVTDGQDGARVVLSRQKSLDLICRPSLALRVIKSFMALRDNLDGLQQDPRVPGFRVADLTLGFNVFGWPWMMARAHLESLRADNAELMARGSVADMLSEGAWQLTLVALSERWLPEVVQRDLFLFGLDELPLLREVRERGLKKGQTLGFRFERGHGQVSLGTQTAELPGALDVARAYLEFHMLGGLILEHAEHAMAALRRR